MPSPNPEDIARVVHNMGNRQEFYVRFKGPEESQYICKYVAHAETDGM